jgi:glycosyltransferase involved in cell wall biosynthesis
MISVVIPCYNQGSFITDAVESILKQSYQNWECIIVNDGSTDDSLDIIKEIKKRDNRIVVFNQEKQGVSIARNNGILKSRGEYIQFLDSDDSIESNKFQWSISVFDINKDIDAVVANTNYFKCVKYNSVESVGVDVSMQQFITSKWLEDKKLVEKLLENNFIPINAPIIKKELLIKVGLFDKDLETMEDWNLWTKCALSNAYFFFDNVPKTSALVRIHGLSTSNERAKMLHGHFLHTLKISPYIKKRSFKILNFRLGVIRLKQSKGYLPTLDLFNVTILNISATSVFEFLSLLIRNFFQINIHHSL